MYILEQLGIGKIRNENFKFLETNDIMLGHDYWNIVNVVLRKKFILICVYIKKSEYQINKLI